MNNGDGRMITVRYLNYLYATGFYIFCVKKPQYKKISVVNKVLLAGIGPTRSPE
jgi:hypothetical protein